MVPTIFRNLTTFFDIQFKSTFDFNFPIFKVPSERFFSQGFQNRSHFLKYVVLKISKFSPKLSTFQWDTLYKQCFTGYGRPKSLF